MGWFTKNTEIPVEKVDLAPIKSKLLDLAGEIQLIHKKMELIDTDLSDMRGRINKRLGMPQKPAESEEKKPENSATPQDINSLIPKYL